MGGQIDGHDVENDVQGPIGVQVKIAYQTYDLFPDKTSTPFDRGIRFNWATCGGRVGWAQTTGQLYSEFAVTL